MQESREKQVDIKKQYSGTTYQIKVLLLLLYRGMKIENNENFYLRTEVKDAEKFDDALFYCKKKGESVYRVRYCQIKNSESKNAELKYSDFVNNFDKAVANIKKYFISYRKIKMKAINENEKVEDFVLCTSYKLPLELKKHMRAGEDEILKFKVENKPDELFGTCSEKWKKYNIVKISAELQNSLTKASNLYLLAEELIECIIKNSSKIIINFQNFWLNMYQNALKSEKVIVEKTFLTSSGILVTNKHDVYIFSEHFLKNEGISKECEKFRKIMLNLCGEKFMNLRLRDKKFSADISFLNLLEKKCRDPSEDEIQMSAEEISEYIYNDKQLTSDIAVQNMSLKKIFKTAGLNFVKFTGDFVQNKNLNDATRRFREYLIIYYAVMELQNLELKLLQNESTSCINVTNDNHQYFQNFTTGDDDIEKEIKEFFEKFSIQTMPHQDELTKLMKEEIEEEFNLLEDKWITNSLLEKVEEWFKKSEDIPFDKSKIQKYYEEIKEELKRYAAERNFYVEMLKTYNLSFEKIPDKWKHFLNPLDGEKDKRNQLLLLTTNEPILTAIKVENAISSINLYKKQESFIMIPASVLLQMENLIAALKSKACYFLIVVVDDDKTKTLELFKYHLAQSEKIIILITAEKQSAYEIIKKQCIFHKDEDNFHFDQLSSAAKESVLQKNVLFQGVLIPLKALLNDTYDLIDSRTIIEIMSNNSVLEIGEMLKPHKEYDEEFYIERKIVLNKITNDFFNKTFSHCFFLVEGNDVKERQNFSMRTIKNDQGKFKAIALMNNFFITSSENAEYEFQRLCEQNSVFPVYWFKLRRNGSLFWFHCSNFAFDWIPEYRYEHEKVFADFKKLFTEKFNEEEKLAVDFLCQSKTVLITDSPGMGKSTVLSHLIQRIPTDFMKWKVRIDLNNYTRYLKEIKESNADFQDIGKYVMDKLYGKIPPNDEEKPFTFRVFDEMYQQNKVLLIFDGFDEISPDYETLVLEMLNRLRTSTQNHLWITSRLNMKETLEQKFKSLSFNIMPFTVNDQKHFLKKFWKSRYKKGWNPNHERHFTIYIENLVEKFNEMTKRNDTDIIGIPLQTKMLGDVFQENEETETDWQSCFKFLEDNTNCNSQTCYCLPSLDIKLQNLYEIYESFVKKYIERYLNDKKEIDNSKVGASLLIDLQYKEIYKVHKIFGIMALIGDSELKKLQNEVEYELKISLVQQIKSDDAGFGLISDISDDEKPLFTHLTFAEFFAANYLIEKLVSHPYEAFQAADTILQSDVPVFLYCIKYLIKTQICMNDLEKAMGNTTVINFVSKHGLFNALKYLTVEDSFEEIFPQIDKFEKTFLQYAVEFNQLKCVVFILLLKYNGFSKSDVLKKEFVKQQNMEIKSEDIDLINIERNTRFFLLQEFIFQPDIHGKSALDYSTNPGITEMLNDFIQIGRNTFIPKKEEKAALASIQWIGSEYDLIKNVNESVFSMNDILYFCSLKTLTTIIDNCENLIVNNNIFLSRIERNFFDPICSRSDISEDQKISFYNYLIEKPTMSDMKHEIVASMLESSIIHDNWEIIVYVFQQQNICNLPDQINHWFKIACKSNKLKFASYLLKNFQKHYITDCIFEANVIFLEKIFEQFGEHKDLKQQYAENFLLNMLKQSFHCPSVKEVKFLLSKGAGIYFADNDGKTAWNYAIENNYNDIVQIMVPYLSEQKIKSIFQKYICDESKNEIFNCFEVFELEDEKLCVFLICKSKNVNIKDDKGKTPLIYACEKGWLRVVTLLLEMGACFEDVFDENDCLHDYCLKNYTVAALMKDVKLYFDNKTSPSIEIYWKTVNKEGQPLWYIIANTGEKINTFFSFCEGDYCEIMKEIQFCNLIDSEGNTALHLAAKGGFKEVVMKLLKKGEYYNIKNNCGQTPKDLTKNEDVLRLFEKIDGLFDSVIKKAHPNNINDFKKYISVRDINGRVLLHYAVINGFYLCVSELLVQNNYYANKKDKYQKAPLYYAVENDDVKMVKLLFQNEANLEKTNYFDKFKKNQCTNFIEFMEQLFDIIYKQDIEEFTEKVEIFCHSPVTVFTIYDILNVYDNEKRNLLQYAVDLNNYDLVIFLFKKGAVITNVEIDNCKNESIIRIFEFIYLIFESIESKTYKTSSIIRLIEKNNCIEIIKKVRISMFETLFQVAMEANNSKIVEWLTKNGYE